MAHPNKDEGVRGHNAKLKRMTQDYGAADKSMFKTAKGLLANGPSEDRSFGVEENAPPSKARGDRPRRSSAANPIPTYAKGGRVRQAGGGVIAGSVPMRAAGGRLEGEFGAPSNMPGRGAGRGKRGGTNVNIIVAPQQPQQPPVPVVPPQMPPAAAGPATPPPGLAGAGAGGPGGMPMGGPGMMPPGATPPGLPQLPRKRGGRVHPFSKKEHPDEREDKALVKDMVKPSALKRARGGSIKMTAGAESGPGRLEKTAARARRQSGDKSAEI